MPSASTTGMLVLLAVDTYAGAARSSRRAGLDAAPDLPAGADIGCVRRQRVEDDLGDIGVSVGIFAHVARRVADGGGRHANPAVKPRSAAEAAEDGNRDRLDDRGADHRPRVR